MDQRALLLAAIETYVADVDDESAARILAGDAGELDSTYGGYVGSILLRRREDYVRIDGPLAWIEFSMCHGIVLSEPYPHAV